MLQGLGQPQASRTVRVGRTLAHAFWVMIGAVGSVLLVAGVVNMNAPMIGAALVQLFLAALFLAPRR